MSIHVDPGRVGQELDAIVSRAGGVWSVAPPGGRPAVLHYGSPAGELAACVSRVGIADRSELVTLSLEGPQDMLARVVCAMTGAVLAPGGIVQTGSSWWCAPSLQRVTVVAEPALGGELRERIRGLVARHPALRLHDRSTQWSAIAVIGSLAPDVLSAVGAYGRAGDPRTVAPVSVRRLAGAELTWMLQSDHRALALVHDGHAPAVWHALQAAGRRYGICAVGHEAVTRYTLLAGTRPGL